MIKISGVKCVKNAKKITGKVFVSKAAVKIKAGKKAYKKAAVKGKKFTLKLNYRLKKNTKVTIKVTKKGYGTLARSFKVQDKTKQIASEEETIAKYTIKDSVFSDLFKIKKYLLQLYKALHPEDKTATENELTYITIKNVLTDGIYND